MATGTHGHGTGAGRRGARARRALLAAVLTGKAVTEVLSALVRLVVERPESGLCVVILACLVIRWSVRRVRAVPDSLTTDSDEQATTRR